MTDVIDAIFPGQGPFAIPLLQNITSLDSPGHPEFALLRCEFEDGAPVFVPIANQAVAVLIDLLSIHQMKLAEREATNEPRH